MGQPLFIIPKPNDKVRFLTDFHELIKRIMRKPNPLLRRLYKFTYASAIDLNMWNTTISSWMHTPWKQAPWSFLGEDIAIRGCRRELLMLLTSSKLAWGCSSVSWSMCAYILDINDLLVITLLEKTLMITCRSSRQSSAKIVRKRTPGKCSKIYLRCPRSRFTWIHSRLTVFDRSKESDRQPCSRHLRP